MTLSIGAVLNGRYRVVKPVGQGGFGAVYRAWDTVLRVPVALKENTDTSPDAQRQFEREAHLLASLSHPSLPRVTDHFVLPHQGQYLVMDFVEGKSLADMLQERGGPLSMAEARPWVQQISSALEYLHGRTPPIIHRDVKPQNILVTGDGRAVLVDFGISKVYDAARGTTTGARAVTPGYSPPEQYGKGKTDARSDVYALGATLYTLLTGQEPPESVNLIGGGLLPAPRALNPAINPAVEQAILEAMNPDKSRRLPSAAAFQAALDAPAVVRSAAPGVAMTTQHPATTPPLAQPSRPSWLWLVAGLTIALLAVAGTFFWQPWRTHEPTPDPSEGTIVAIAEAGSEMTAEAGPTVTTASADAQTPRATKTAAPTAAPTATNPPAATQAPPPGGVPLTEQVQVPAGAFTMGSDEGDGALPVHSVTLEAFTIDRTEVTAAQYAAFLNEFGNQVEGGVPWLDVADEENFITAAGGTFQAKPGMEALPVIQVSWYGAKAYCQAVGRRLPTDAEWEKAARGTDGRTYPWGDAAIDCTLANFWNGNANRCVGLPVGVGSYAVGASPYGALDMAGNVWEWVDDWYDSNQDTRVLRSGSYLDKAAWATTYHRHRGLPANQYAHTGFRCAGN